ncbi:TetR family transcriptional regulator [Streptomyces sioyaensis]|uniref:TetR family transcriptional regulator n=1 Tax=Streptomyces sioyaensis TaxID=67364 RepID=UPI0037CCF7E7
MSTGSGPGRRERRKQRTHEALMQAAARLFQDHGYEATTVKDIAVAAGIGERTFFRYFPSKESLILQQVKDLIPLLGQAVRARPAEEPALVALCNALLGFSRDELAPGLLLTGPQPLPASPTSRGVALLLFDLEESVASAFLDRLTADGRDPEDADTLLQASVLARAGVGTLRALRLTYNRLPESKRSTISLNDFVRQAFASLTRP